MPSSTSYRFDPGAPPATGTPPGQLRLDNVNASLATLIDLRLLDSDGADRSLWLRVLDAGCKIRITDWNDASIHHSYDVTGPATLDATNASIPVAWTTGLGTIPAGTINVGFLTALEVF